MATLVASTYRVCDVFRILAGLYSEDHPVSLSPASSCVIPPFQYNKTRGNILVDECINFENVWAISPAAEVVSMELNVRVDKGQSLAITGPNGSGKNPPHRLRPQNQVAGKTSMMRQLAALWQIDLGTVTRPANIGRDGLMYASLHALPLTTLSRLMPQVPYFPQGSLALQVGFFLFP